MLHVLHDYWAQQTALAALDQAPDNPVPPQLLEFCNEAWRVVVRDGELFIRTPC